MQGVNIHVFPQEGDAFVTLESPSFDAQARQDALSNIVTDPVRMRNVLERHLLSADDRRVQILKCRPGPLRTRGDSHCTVQYDLDVHDATTDSSIVQMVSGVTYPAGRTRAVWEALRREMPQSSSTSLRPYAYVPDLDMLIQVFPHDHQLPALASLMAGAPPALESSLIDDLGSRALRVESWRSEPVRYRLGQSATVRLIRRARRVSSGELVETAYYAKVYREADRARDAFDILRNLNSRADAETVHFSAPAPIAYAEDLRTVIQAGAPGVPLAHLLRHDRAKLRAIQAAARAVADLHGLALETPRPRGRDTPRLLQRRLSRLEWGGELISTERPDLAPDMASIVSAVKDGISRAPVAPVHGDLKPNHILVDGDAISLIDFDDMQASDPMLDVANMETYLARLQPGLPLGADRDESMARVFVESYFAHAPDATLARLTVYRVMANIGEVVRWRRSSDPRWPHRIGEVVREASAALAQDG